MQKQIYETFALPNNENQSKRIILEEKKESDVLPKVISLFCGAGGLDWGFLEVGFDISYSVDYSTAAIQTHKRNFKKSKSVVMDLTSLTAMDFVNMLSKSIEPGSSIGVIGGPPCQGFSRANNKSYADDPRNKLPSVYLDIVFELQKVFDVQFLVFENVLGIKDKKHKTTFDTLLCGISNLGFDLEKYELCASEFGVAQRRKRVILFGLASKLSGNKLKLETAVEKKVVRDVISDLDEPAYFRYGLGIDEIPTHPNHWTMRPKSPRFSDANAKFNQGRSFKKLEWDDISPTIAFGNREIHVHPNGHRRLSIYEAMLLQGFPSYFVLEGNLSEQVTQVSNAVPPPMAYSIANGIKKVIKGFSHEQ